MARFTDIPEAMTCAENKKDTLKMAQDALSVALSSYIDDQRDIPKPSKPKRGQVVVELPPLTSLKVEIYQTMKDKGISIAEMAKRMDRDRGHIKRLRDLDHHTRMDQIEAALLAVGKKLVVETVDCA